MRSSLILAGLMFYALFVGLACAMAAYGVNVLVFAPSDPPQMGLKLGLAFSAGFFICLYMTPYSKSWNRFVGFVMEFTFVDAHGRVVTKS